MFQPINFEARRRHAFLEEAQVELADTLAQMPDTDVFGVPISQRISPLLNNLFIPDIRNGKVVTTSNVPGTDATPLVTLSPGESLHWDADLAAITPRQTESATGIVKDIHANKIDNQEAAEMLGTISEFAKKTVAMQAQLQMRKGLAGSVYSSPGGFSWVNPVANGSTKFVLLGRPLVTLLNSKQYSRAVTLGHELIHVKQNLEKPIVSFDDVFAKDKVAQKELEAYHYSAKIGETLLRGGSVGLEVALRFLNDIGIENMRSRHADSAEPFSLTPALSEALKAATLSWI